MTFRRKLHGVLCWLTFHAWGDWRPVGGIYRSLLVRGCRYCPAIEERLQ